MFNLQIQKSPKWEGFTVTGPEDEDSWMADVGSGPGTSSSDKEHLLRKVVVATDLSVGGAAALTAGGAMTRRTGAKLSVVSVVEPPKSPDLLHPAEPGIAEWVDSQQDRVRWKLEIELEKAGLSSALVHVSVGDPAILIQGFAEKTHSNLIVIGAHRLSSFERVLAGSTGERIVRHAACPVMVATPHLCGPFKRILVAVDLSPNSSTVLDTALALARCDGAEVRVVHSEEPFKSVFRNLTLGENQANLICNRKRFEELVRDSEIPGDPEAIVLHGHAGRAVLGQARKWDADLIVMGLRRLTFPSSTRLGRTTRYVLRRGERSMVLVPS